jgi:hypothetical protein
VKPPRGFLAGLHLRHFMDTHEEWHAFVQGFCEVLCPWPPRHRAMKPALLKEVQAEHHYYMFGRALGVVAWVLLVCLIAALFS